MSARRKPGTVKPRPSPRRRRPELAAIAPAEPQSVAVPGRALVPVRQARPQHRPAPGPIAAIEAAPAGAQVAAFIDFDGTLIPGYSILAFLAERWRNRQIGRGDLERAGTMLLEAATGQLDNSVLIRRGMQEWRGRGLADLEKLGQKLFARELEPDMFPEMLAIVQAHQRQGHTVVLATSSAAFQCMPAAAALGIEHVLCTRLQAADGVLTGEPDGPILWGRQKAIAAREFAAARGIELGDSWFYADGDEDEALMHLVGNPCPVNPHDRLARVAARRGWPVLRFESRGRPGAELVARSALATASAVPVMLGAAAWRWLTGDKRAATNLMTATLPAIALRLGRVELDVQGAEHLWSDRPAVFIWNHRNIFDAQIVGRLVEKDFGAVAKKELARVPIFAAASRFMHIAFLDREKPQEAIEALKPATELLQQGVSMVVAPEGTRVAGSGVGPFKKGAFRMAMEARVPIVPIVIRNACDVGARNAQVMRPARVDVVVLPPIALDGWTLDNLGERIERVRQQFVDTLASWPARD